jgi:hypothetical protein
MNFPQRMAAIFAAVVIAAATLSATGARAGTFSAKVEQGNTVVIFGSSKSPETCEAAVQFTYVPAGGGPREYGAQQCPLIQLTPRPVELCRMDYPVTGIKIAGPVKATCK